MLKNLRVFAVLAFLPSSAFAWSVNGHKIVGRIAQDLLVKSAQHGDAAAQSALANLRYLLGNNFSLAELAPCADQVRLMDEETQQVHIEGTTVRCGGLQLPVNPKSEPWHFIDIPITADESPDTVESYCPGENCVVGRIKSNLETLRDLDASFDDKRVALMYVVHFVGDEHQPLHCATDIADGTSDRGGNGKQVRFEGKTLNLHALWDHLIEARDDVNSPEDLAQKLESEINGDSQRWVDGDFVTEAALESFQASKKTIYPAYYDARGSFRDVSLRRSSAIDLPSSYRDALRPLAEDRLKLGGVRLQELLKQALGTSRLTARSR